MKNLISNKFSLSINFKSLKRINECFSTEKSKRKFLLLLGILVNTFGTAQNPVLTFDGRNDYIDLGANAGNGVRTIEMWFKLNEPITPQLNDFVTLTAREISRTNNTNEFALSFQPSFVANPGTLRFDIDGTQPFKSVYSDNNTWEMDRWYHVAAGIDPTDGMMLFVDGTKQMSTHPYTGATAESNSITTIGCWGNFYARYFKGSIDDVRFSSEALYSENFTPPCPDIAVMNSTIGLWNFNEGAGDVVADSGSGNFDGQLVGPNWSSANICGNVLSFDGRDDYVDLGTQAGNAVRTIEMWFKLNEAITPRLSEFVTLTAREISQTNNNDEFAFSFQPAYVSNSGKLRFDIDGTQPFKSVYSNSNTWEMDRWYHVAAVIDPTDGMMLFVDGVKQNSTHPYTGATANSTSITTIGCWGNLFDRYFNGSIDDVRFSSEALYKENFKPICPDVEAMNNTVGLWNFNEGIGSIALDYGNNNFDGKLMGPKRIHENACPDSLVMSLPETDNIEQIVMKVYPNPSRGLFNLSFDNSTSSNYEIDVYNSLGKMILSKKITTGTYALDLTNEPTGMYYYQITGKSNLVSGKLLKE